MANPNSLDYCDHPTPKMYGFESYISVPVYRPGGEFFGTLCALDPLPAAISNQKVVNAGVGGGLGLGLYIVAEIARSHNGVMEVTSTAGATTFSFAMPPDAQGMLAA